MLGSRAIPALAAGATSSAPSTLTLPATASGTYRIIAKADADDAVLEVNEANNVSAVSLPFTLGPDLVAWQDVPAASAFPAAGATISVTDFTRNDAATAAPATTTRLYYSAGATFDGSAVVVGSRAIPALGPGEVNSGTISFTLPAGDVGARYLFVEGGCGQRGGGEQREQQREHARGAITIGGDLIVSIDVPGGVANSLAGATVTVNDWTRSDNAAPVGASTTKFYLMTGTTLDGSAVLLGEPGVPALGAVDDEHGHDDADLAGDRLGDYRIIAKADADNAVAEANEGNNVSAASAPFTLGPDLVAWLDVPAASATPGGGGDDLGDGLRAERRGDGGAGVDDAAVLLGGGDVRRERGDGGEPGDSGAGAGAGELGTISFTLPAGGRGGALPVREGGCGRGGGGEQRGQQREPGEDDHHRGRT